MGFSPDGERSIFAAAHHRKLERSYRNKQAHHRTPRPLAIPHVLLGIYSGSVIHSPRWGLGNGFSPDQSIWAVESAWNGQAVRHSTENGMTRGYPGVQRLNGIKQGRSCYQSSTIPFLSLPFFLSSSYILSIRQYGCWRQASQHLHIQEEWK